VEPKLMFFTLATPFLKVNPKNVALWLHLSTFKKVDQKSSQRFGSTFLKGGKVERFCTTFLKSC